MKRREEPIIIRRRGGAGPWIVALLALMISGGAAFMAWTGWPHEPTVVVNVPPQPAPTVNVAAPEVHVMPPEVHIDAPVTVQPSPAPSVTVQTESGYLKCQPPYHWWNKHTITCADWRP